MIGSVYKLAGLNFDFFESSLTEKDGVEFGLCRTPRGKKLVTLRKSENTVLPSFEGEFSETAVGDLHICALNPTNARELRSWLDWLIPRPLGTAASAGMGDRIGLATPGHVRAVKRTQTVQPIFAQQSIREMSRTDRTPQQVMDDATWGVFQEGWQGGVGADADHLKTPEDIDYCLASGYTFFTIDPGAYVNYGAELADSGILTEIASQLPKDVQPQKTGLLGKKFEVEGYRIEFNENALLRACVKYGKVVDHVAGMYRHLVSVAGNHPYELEVSVDETDQPTTLLEHFYIASELNRLGVQWVSLAPRYVGSFEKGVDYIGDLKLFEAEFSGHAAIARHFGGYKLSLHSGSDKFSIYPIVNRLANGRVHLKTAGTSYLEALRTVADVDPGLFLGIYQFARDHYEADRVSYHVSAELSRAPLPGDVIEPTRLLDQFDAREILHVTFGSVLTSKRENGYPVFYQDLMSCLEANSEAYAANLEKHFIKHLQFFGKEN
jgi:hypothetical protein